MRYSIAQRAVIGATLGIGILMVLFPPCVVAICAYGGVPENYVPSATFLYLPEAQGHIHVSFLISEIALLGITSLCSLSALRSVRAKSEAATYWREKWGTAENSPETLLRASAQTITGDSLLRPALPASKDDPQQLLRAHRPLS